MDRGNLAGPANPWLPPVEGYRHLAEVVAWNRAVHDAVLAELRCGACRSCWAATTAWPSARSARWRATAARTAARSCACCGSTPMPTSTPARADPSGNLHGMPVACLCGHGPRGAGGDRRPGAGDQPEVDPPDRHPQRRPGREALRAQAGLEVFDMRYIDEMGMRHTMELALATLDANTHLHVSFDVDFLDPEIAPGVGTTVPGGPTYREAQLCMEMIADTGRLASLDVMELNPALDVRNKTAELAVDLIESLFGKSTLMRDESGEFELPPGHS
jgi:arginase